MIDMFKPLFFALSILACAAPYAFAGSNIAAAEIVAAQPKVLMYVMPNCGYCAKARQYLNERSVTFSEIDIAASDANNQRWRADGGQGTPLILIGAEKINGFNQEAIDRALTVAAK